MIFTYDMYNNLKQSKAFLANPNKKYIGTLYNAKNEELLIKFNDISEVTFTIHEKENGEHYPHYNDIQELKLVEIQYVAWFRISEVNEVNDGVDNYKEVKCETLEIELTGKRVDDINGVFALYNYGDQEHSLLHICTNGTGWSIGHVDNELIDIWRTFSIDTSKIYNLLMTDVSKSFECCFIYNTYEKTINAYKLSNVGKLTNIIISYKNILNEFRRNSKAEKIITKLKVVGSDGFDIRAVNFGLNYIMNLDYFMTTDWCSQSLVDAWNTYKTKISTYNTNFTNTLNTLKTQQSELTVLETELVNIQGLTSTQNIVIGTTKEALGRVPVTTDTEYDIYQNAITALATYTTQEALKKIDITNKKTQISSTQAILDAMQIDIDIDNNFTSEQLSEMIPFITENDEYEDSTFAEYDTMTSTDIINMKLELLQNASNELARASKPQFTVDISANNLFAIKDDGGYTTYENMRQDCEVGNLLTIKFGNDNYTTARLVSLSIKFDDLFNIDLTFSDKSRFDSELIQLGGLLANAGRTASTINLNKIGYDAASNQVSLVRKFMNGSFNATLNSMVNNDNVETEFGKFGIKNKQWLPDQNKYSDYQSWWNQNTLLFSSDGFKSAQTGIGLFTNSDDETFYGVLAPVICGDLVMSSKLRVTNTSGNFVIDNKGFVASATVSENDYSVTINPSSPANIFNISVNNVAKLYVDTTTNQLVMNGYINATGGTLGSLTVLGTLTGGTISGSSVVGGILTGGSINIADKFIVDSDGILNAVGGNFSGIINGSEIKGSTFVSYYPNEEATTRIVLQLNYTEFSAEKVTGTNTLLASANYGWQGMMALDHEDIYNPSIEILAGLISLKDIGGQLFILNRDTFQYKDSNVLTVSNFDSSIIDTSQIIPKLTSAGNIDFNGTENAAAVNWVQLYYYSKVQVDENFATKNHAHSGYATSSDITAVTDWVTANFQPKA